MTGGNRSRGKVDGLPDELKAEVDAKLVKGVTYAEISSFLKAKGYDVHFASVGRYGQRYLKKFESVRIAREFSKALAEDSIDRPATEIHEANNLIASQMAMEMAMDGEMTPDDKMKLMHAMSALQKAQSQNERLKIEARKSAGAIRSAMNALRDKVFETLGENYPEVAELIMKIADDVENQA